MEPQTQEESPFPPPIETPVEGTAAAPTPAVETKPEAETSVEEPVDAGKSLVGSIDVNSIDTETREVAPQATPEDVLDDSAPEQGEDAELENGHLMSLLNALGELEPGEETDDFFNKLTPDHIKDLPVEARHIVRNLWKANEAQKAKYQQGLEAQESKVTSRLREVAQRERDFLQREQAFSALIEDPKVQEVLSQTESELPDAFTEEGINARIQKGIAEGLQQVFQPFQHAAAQKRQEASYMDFLNAHPEMHDATFKQEVLGIIEERRGSGSPVSTQDAYSLNKLRRLQAAEELRQAEVRQARQTSARKVARSTTTGSPGGEEIPPEVKKNAVKLAAWLQAHPEARRRIEASR